MASLGQVPREWSGWGAARRAQPMRLWVSARGSVSPLHFDSAGSFLCQLRGRKRVILFPPNALDRLYPYPVWPLQEICLVSRLFVHTSIFF